MDKSNQNVFVFVFLICMGVVVKMNEPTTTTFLVLPRGENRLNAYVTGLVNFASSTSDALPPTSTL